MSKSHLKGGMGFHKPIDIQISFDKIPTMSRVEDQDIIQTSRGGALDTLVKVCSLGTLGVETTVKQTLLRPTNLLDLDDPLSPSRRALETGKTVVIQSFGPRIERKIVPNKKR